MRKLYDIIEDVKDNKKPDYEELRYALLVYESMFILEHRRLREELISEKETPEFIKELQLRNSFEMFKTALNKSPKEFLGWNNDPENPEYQRFRKASIKLLDRLIEGDLHA